MQKFGQKAFYNEYLGEQKQTWTVNVSFKHKIFLQILKQDCFLFLLFIKDKNGKGPCATFFLFYFL